MKAFRRSLLALGLAALLPIAVFAAVQVVYMFQRDRQDVQQAYLARSADVMRLIDARIEADLSAIRVLVSATLDDAPDWREFHARAGRVLADNPHWATIIVTEGDTGRVLADVARGLEAPAASLTLDPSLVFRNERGIVGGVTPRQSGAPAPRVYLQQPVLRDRKVQYRVTVPIDPTIYQDILLEHTPAADTSGVVDRAGRFIARNLNYQERLGALATTYVREAIPKGEGFYAGKTLEGVDNYTAFTTSEFSGWSTHIAVPKRLFDAARIGSYVVAGLAGLAALLVGGYLTLVVLREMADRRRADESLRQSQKLEAIGQLTGGIAHDFNNLLTAIIGGLDMISRRATDERTQRTATNALEAARRGAKLTSQLLAFSRKQPMAIGTVDLQAVLDGMTALLAQSLGPTIRVSVRIAPDARYVISDAAQLELSVLNLAVNARDAMPNGGTFVVKTAHADKELCAHLPPRDYVQIEISDSGTGMSEEVQARAFEPFFTTKPQGAGTGLGLSQVFGVVQQSTGATHIRSEPGMGTTIVLILPRGEAAAVPRTVELARPAEASVAERSRASILVVDDDKQVRRIMVESLRSRGYRIAEASGGAEAMDLMGASQPDLLVIDLSMPGRSGAEVVRSARQIYPDLKVLMVSGHADVSTISQQIGHVPLLHKPFDGDTLAEAVERVLRDEWTGEAVSN